MILPKSTLKKFALFAEGNPSGAVSTGPESKQNCTAGLVSCLVPPANLPALWVFPLYSRNHPYRVADNSLKTCMKGNEKGALAARETLGFTQGLVGLLQKYTLLLT